MKDRNKNQRKRRLRIRLTAAAAAIAVIIVCVLVFTISHSAAVLNGSGGKTGQESGAASALSGTSAESGAQEGTSSASGTVLPDTEGTVSSGVPGTASADASGAISADASASSSDASGTLSPDAAGAVSSDASGTVATGTPDSAAAIQPVQKVTDLTDISAGTVIPAEAFDNGNMDQYFTSSGITEGDPVYQRIIGKSYRENDDIALSDLRYLKLVHYNFDGQIQVGEMIVNASLAGDILSIFRQLFADGYQIFEMYLVDDFWAGNGIDTDTASCEADNTSCFNYRRSTSSSSLSKHALGRAVDINPRENPYVEVQADGSKKCDHANAGPYIENRTSEEAHVITHEDEAYSLFTQYGFKWGGDWSNPIDYQHFEK